LDTTRRRSHLVCASASNGSWFIRPLFYVSFFSISLRRESPDLALCCPSAKPTAPGSCPPSRRTRRGCASQQHIRRDTHRCSPMPAPRLREQVPCWPIGGPARLVRFVVVLAHSRRRPGRANWWTPAAVSVARDMWKYCSLSYQNQRGSERALRDILRTTP
jgi:hypothetical protein